MKAQIAEVGGVDGGEFGDAVVTQREREAEIDDLAPGKRVAARMIPDGGHHGRISRRRCCGRSSRCRLCRPT